MFVTGAHATALNAYPMSSTWSVSSAWSVSYLQLGCLQVAGQDYIVDSLVIQYKLVKGRYERCHHRLDVLSTSRYLLNRNLECAFSSPSAEDRQ